MFQTAETLATGRTNGVMCKEVDFVYSKLDIPKVKHFLATEAEQRQKLCERIRAQKISNKIDQRRSKFLDMSVNTLLQMLVDAEVPGRYKTAGKKKLVNLAIAHKIQIPGDSPYKSDPEAENMQYFDKYGKKLDYKKLAVAAKECRKMPQIHGPLATEDSYVEPIEGCAGGEIGDIGSSVSQRKNEDSTSTTSTTRPPVRLSPQATIPHPSAEGESRFQVSPYSEQRDKQPLMDLLRRQYGWTSGPVGRKKSEPNPSAFFKPGKPK